MKKILLFTTYYLLLATLSSCFLLGIHINVHNPKHAGKYPKFSESIKLLGSLNKYRTCFDATFYNLNIYVDHKNKYLKGKVEMHATALSDFDTLQIDLYQNMKVNKIISSDGKELNYSRKFGDIFVKMTRTMKKGENFKISIDYEGSPVVAKKPPWKGGFVWKKDKDENPWIGVACETEGASLWWPCKDVTNDEPDSVSINITVPKNLVAVANGQLREKQENGNFTTYKWFVSYTINLYNVTLYIGNFVLISDSYTSPVSGKILPINHYVLPMNYEKAKNYFSQAKEQIAFYEKTFGEYPWYRDGYKLVESPYAGMEHQSAIAYGNGYKMNYGGFGGFGEGFDYIILHESAHEWWGNSVTAADLADVWVHEGFATYAEALYVESTQGQNAYLRYLFFYRLFIKNKRPVVGPVGVRFFDYKDGDVYVKGAWILHTLRTLINNDKIFFDIIKTFYGNNKMKTVTSQDFINVVNEKTGENYGWFFKQYLNNHKVPFLEYYWDGKDIFYRWANTDSTFKMPVELKLDGMKSLNIKPSNIVQKVQVSSEYYKSISFPSNTLLFGKEENKKLKKEAKTICH
ncbi:MAG: M1 family metallopeptidase [Bacteroidota bacterium]